MTQMNKELMVPIYSWWQMFLISVFDVDVTTEKFVPSLNAENRMLSIMIPKYSLGQMLKMMILQSEE